MLITELTYVAKMWTNTKTVYWKTTDEDSMLINIFYVYVNSLQTVKGTHKDSEDDILPLKY